MFFNEKSKCCVNIQKTTHIFVLFYKIYSTQNKPHGCRIDCFNLANIHKYNLKNNMF